MGKQPDYPPLTPRPVKPRLTLATNNLPFIIWADNHLWLESQDIYYPESALLNIVLTHKSAILVCPYNTLPNLLHLEKRLADFPGWDFQIRFKERTIYRSDGTTSKRSHPTVSWIGFRYHKDKRDSKNKGKSKYKSDSHSPESRLFFIFDPESYADRLDFRQTYPHLTNDTDRYKAFVFALRAFCNTQGIKLLGSAGAVASQFLRDPRFYPECRRKVPRATNAKAREALPGNHYQLFQDTSSERFTGIYLDQISSHHTIASQIPLPYPDTLFARGWYADYENMRPWLMGSLPKTQEFLDNHHGLLFCRIFVGKDSPYLIPKARGVGWKDLFLFTNECRYLLEIPGVQLAGICASWTSLDRDSGIRRFANWSLSQVKNAPPEIRPWLKPTLLATYGMLAAVPRKMEFGMRSEEPDYWFTIPGPISNRFGVKKVTARTSWEPSYVNVIQRGMIEAETRVRSLSLARQLDLEGFRILCIYADGIIIEGTEVPTLPPEWTVESCLTNLEFLTTNRFISDQVSKLPGTLSARELRRRRAQEPFHAGTTQFHRGVRPEDRNPHRAA